MLPRALPHEALDGLVERAGVDAAAVPLPRAAGLGAQALDLVGPQGLHRRRRDEPVDPAPAARAGSPSWGETRRPRDRRPRRAPAAAGRRPAPAAPPGARATTRASPPPRAGSAARLVPAWAGAPARPRARAPPRDGGRGRGWRSRGRRSNAASMATRTVARGTPASCQPRARAKSRGESTCSFPRRARSASSIAATKASRSGSRGGRLVAHPATTSNCSWWRSGSAWTATSPPVSAGEAPAGPAPRRRPGPGPPRG